MFLCGTCCKAGRESTFSNDGIRGEAQGYQGRSLCNHSRRSVVAGKAREGRFVGKVQKVKAIFQLRRR